LFQANTCKLAAAWCAEQENALQQCNGAKSKQARLHMCVFVCLLDELFDQSGRCLQLAQSA
jgi:hypothetical protein